jgi:hypothetical protein
MHARIRCCTQIIRAGNNVPFAAAVITSFRIVVVFVLVSVAGGHGLIAFTELHFQFADFTDDKSFAIAGHGGTPEKTGAILQIQS